METQTKSNKIDKRDYSPGDKANDGTIGDVFYSYQEYVIYRDKVDNSIAFEANSPSGTHKRAYNLLKKIRNDATMCLTRRRQDVVDKMLVNALNSTITHDENSSNEFDIEEEFKEVTDYVDTHRSEVSEVLYQHDDFMIYLLEDNKVKWWHKNSSKYIDAVGEFEKLYTVATTILQKNVQTTAAIMMLSTALAAAFRSKSLENLEDLFDEARTFIYTEIRSVLKYNLFYRIIMASGLMMILLSVILFSKSFFDGNEIYDLYFFCSIAGALGATVSALQRINKISFDIYSSKTSLYIESLNRIIIGIVFSLFLLMAIKSGIVFSNYSSNIYAIISLAFIGGFSERFVPSIISNVDKGEAQE